MRIAGTRRQLRPLAPRRSPDPRRQPKPIDRIAPAIHLKTALPLPHERFTGLTAICIDGDPAYQSETTLTFDSPTQEFLPGDILLSPLLRNRAT